MVRSFLKTHAWFSALLLLTACGLNDPKPSNLSKDIEVNPLVTPSGREYFMEPSVAPEHKRNEKQINFDVVPTGTSTGKFRYKTEDTEIVYEVDVLKPEEVEVKYKYKIIKF